MRPSETISYPLSADAVAAAAVRNSSDFIMVIFNRDDIIVGLMLLLSADSLLFQLSDVGGGVSIAIGVFGRQFFITWYSHQLSLAFMRGRCSILQGFNFRRLLMRHNDLQT